MKCVKCNKDISDSAKFCPYCGNQIGMNEAVAVSQEAVAVSQPECQEQESVIGITNEETRKSRRNIKKLAICGGAIIFVLFICLVIFNNNSARNTHAQIGRPDFVVEPKELCREYEENKFAAEHKYKGKIIQLTGTISSIREDFDDDSKCIFLDSTDVQCHFEGKGLEELYKVKEGDMVTVQGICGERKSNVNILKCRIVTDNEFDTSSEEADTTPEENNVIFVSPVDILKEYQENKFAAEHKYKGKTVQLTGKIRSIANDAYDDSKSIHISAGAITSDVQCHFQGKGLEDLYKVKDGEVVTVRGICGEYMSNVNIYKTRIIDDESSYQQNSGNNNSGDEGELYSDDHILGMAMEYYRTHNGYDCENLCLDIVRSEGNQVEIRIYEEGEHQATFDRYYVDRITGKGTNSQGEPIDLTQSGSFSQGDGSGTVQIKGTRVNMRSAPSTSASVVYQFPGYETVSVLDKTDAEAGKYPWYKVFYNGHTGWVYGQFVK